MRSTSPPQPGNVREMVAMARSFLERKGVEEARLEAELLTAHALGLDRMGVFLRLDAPVSGAEIDRARDLFVRRGRREPVAYIVGKREFYGQDFLVGPGVLIPRPETEGLVDLVRERAPQTGARILDVGVGCGTLAVTLARHLEDARVWAVDLSEDALGWARKNAVGQGVDVEFLLGDGLAPAREHGPFDWIVSNPPYVEPGERADLAPEVREFEPGLALYAPPGDPDHWVQRLLTEGQDLLSPGGGWAIELGAGQGPRVQALAERLVPDAKVELHADLAEIDRILEVRVGG